MDQGAGVTEPDQTERQGERTLVGVRTEPLRQVRLHRDGDGALAVLVCEKQDVLRRPGVVAAVADAHG